MNETSPQNDNPQTALAKLRRDTRGLSTVEYIILLSLIVVAAFGTWKKIGNKILKETKEANTELQKL